MSELKATEERLRTMGLRDLEKCAAEAERIIAKRTDEMFELVGLIRQLDYEEFQRISTEVKVALAKGGRAHAAGDVHTD